MTAAHQAYYRSMHGRWHGEVRVAITDRAAFRAAPMGWVDRLQARGVTLLGALAMDTTLDWLTEGERGVAVHTTRVSKWGMPLTSSVERFVLEPDGRSCAMTARVWYPPVPWPMGDYGADARVVVDEDARGAVYHLRIFGGPVVQTTRVLGEDELAIAQDLGGWGRAEVVLRRTSRTL